MGQHTTVENKIRPQWKVPLSLGTIVLCLILSFGIYGETRNVRQKLENSISTWQNELTTALIKKDWLSIKRIGKSLYFDELTQLSVVSNGEEIYAYREDATNANGCMVNAEVPIFRYGLEIGRIKACASVKGIFYTLFRSPLSIAFALSLSTIIYLGSIVPLLRYKRALLTSVGILQKWAAADMMPTLLDKELNKNDPLLSNIVSLVQDGVRRRTEAEKEVAQLKIANDLAAQAAQVSHDIRSPLATLIATVHQATNLDQHTRTNMQNAVNRIREIANNLLSQNRQRTLYSKPKGSEALSSEPHSVELLSAIVDNAISLKRLQFFELLNFDIKFSIDPDAAYNFAEIQHTEFHRIVSNLINNSLEAMDGKGILDVRLCKLGRHVQLNIRDYGKGIPAELLPKVVERGGTFGKQDGNGYGLSHAKATMESWGGSLKIDSKPGKGTIVSLEFTPIDPPAWFADKIKIEPETTVVIVDDEQCIHKLWIDLLANSSTTLIHFNSLKDFLAWYRAQPAIENVIYFCDYEFLGQKYNGIDLINMTGISTHAVLVTNRWDDNVLRDKCQKLRIKLLPKMFLEKKLIQLT